MTAIGLVIGLLVGGITTRIYDRSGFHRIPGAVEMAIAEAHQTQHQARAAKNEGPSAPEHEDATEPDQASATTTSTATESSSEQT
jgi:hypothetical protein